MADPSLSLVLAFQGQARRSHRAARTLMSIRVLRAAGASCFPQLPGFLVSRLGVGFELCHPARDFLYLEVEGAQGFAFVRSFWSVGLAHLWNAVRSFVVESSMAWAVRSFMRVSTASSLPSNRLVRSVVMRTSLSAMRAAMRVRSSSVSGIVSSRSKRSQRPFRGGARKVASAFLLLLYAAGLPSGDGEMKKCACTPVNGGRGIWIRDVPRRAISGGPHKRDRVLGRPQCNAVACRGSKPERL